MNVLQGMCRYPYERTPTHFCVYECLPKYINTANNTLIVAINENRYKSNLLYRIYYTSYQSFACCGIEYITQSYLSIHHHRGN